MLSKLFQKKSKKILNKQSIRQLTSINKGKLVLEDGTTFEGYSFGSKNSNNGEVVFSTNMVGEMLLFFHGTLQRVLMLSSTIHYLSYFRFSHFIAEDTNDC